MPLIKNAEFVENAFAHVADDETLPEGAIVVSLKRWQAERETLIARNAPIGVRLSSDQSPDALGGDDCKARYQSLILIARSFADNDRC